MLFGEKSDSDYSFGVGLWPDPSELPSALFPRLSGLNSVL